MNKLFLKITLNFYLIIEFIKCFSESQIQFLVDHAQTSGKTDLTQYSIDYHHMPFSSFGLNPTIPDPSFTIVGKYHGGIELSQYQVFFQIYNNVNHDQKLVMFGFDELSTPKSLFIRQQYAANSYTGEILCQSYQKIIDKKIAQFTISLKKLATQTDIYFTLTQGSDILCSQTSTITSNMLDWNADFTVQFSDSGVQVPPGQRKEYSAYGSVFSVFLIKDIYIGSYGDVAKQFIKRLTHYSQEGISIINKFNQISKINNNCIPDESIERTICAKSKNSKQIPQIENPNKIPQIENSIATFKKEQDIYFKNLTFYQLFSHYNKQMSQPVFFTYSFWLSLYQSEPAIIQVLKQSSSNILNLSLSVNLIKSQNPNGYKIQVQFQNDQIQTLTSTLVLNFQKFYYLIISYYQFMTQDIRIIIIDETGVLSEDLFSGINGFIFLKDSKYFDFSLQVGKDDNQQSQYFQVSQFQLNLSAAILYDEYSYPVSVDNDQIIKNCQVVILIRLKYNCLVCKIGFYLFKNKCETSCDSGYTPNQYLRTCIRKCSYRCSECEQNDPNKCISCSSLDRDLSNKCECISGYEDQISSKCSVFKAQNMYNSDLDIQHIYDITANKETTIKFRKEFKESPLIIVSVISVNNNNNYLKGIKTKVKSKSKKECTLDIEVSSLGTGTLTEYHYQILAFSMDKKKYYSKQLNFNTPIASVYQQDVDIDQYDITKYGNYRILTFISGIMMGQDSSFNNLFADFKIEVVNDKQQIQVTVNSYVKSVYVTYLVLPESVPSLYQSFTFSPGSFYYDTINIYTSKVHSDTKSITNSFMQDKQYLFTSYFSLTSMGYQLIMVGFRFCYSYASQNDLDKQYSRFEIDTSQASQYSTNGFYFIEDFDQTYDKCTVKDYFTQEGCYKCRIKHADEAQNCDKCKTNRVLNPSSCDCPDPDFKKNYPDEISCSYQNIAVLDVNLSTDFTQIIIDFGLMIEPIQFQLQFEPSYALCKHIFSDDTLDKIKLSATCQISSTNIFVCLDSDATIEKGNYINFKQNIKFIKYTDKITSFLRNKVRQDTLQYVADVVISYNQEINLCEKLRLIQVLEFKNHQRRGLNWYKWSWKLESNQNNLNKESEFKQLIENANSKKELALDITGYFQENSIVTITLEYEYKIGLGGEKKITYKVVTKPILQLKQLIKRNPPFYIKDKVEIFYDISYTKCNIDGKPVQVSPVTYYLTYQTTDNLQLTNTISSTQKQSFSIEIPSYQAKPNIIYKITTKCSVDVSTDTYEIEYLLPFTTIPLLIKIKGGNRQFDYNQEVTIGSTSQDLDVIQIEKQSLGIDLIWSCMTLETLQPCIDIENQIIKIPQGSTSITFPKLTFLSYQTNQFTLIGKKDNKIQEDKIILQFVDKSIPQISFTWPKDFLLKKTINMNEIIESEITIDESINVNSLFFGAAIIYNKEVKATIGFEYGKFRIQLWDYPLNFNQSNSKFQLRILVFNPKYTQPSQETYQFNVNFPPQNCILNISPSSGYSLQTLFTIQVNQCEDPDQPLQYQFYYYNQKQQFDFEVNNPLLVQRKQLSDVIQESLIQSFLPSGELLILVQIFDSKNALKNITQTLSIQQPIYDQQSYINQVQNIIDYSSQQVQTTQILSLSLLCEDMVSRPNYYNFLKNQANNIVNILQKLTINTPKHSTFSTLATQSIQKVAYSKILQIDDTFLQSNYNYISGILDKASSELQKDQFLQSKSNQQLYNCFTLLDAIADSSYNNVENQQSLIKYTEKIGNLLNVDAYPNESAKILKGQKISIVSQVVTSKKLPIFLGYQDGLGSWENLINNKVNKDPMNQVYDVSFKSYEQNIYQQEDEYQNLIKKIQGFKPTLKLNSYKAINPSIQLHASQIEYVPQSSIKFQFQPLGTEPLTCVNRVKGQWSAQGCESIFDKRSDSYSCICDDLSPTTVINDVADIFANNENLDTIFSEDGIQNILSFKNFQDYAAFWVECFIAIIFIIFSLFGIFLDNLRQTYTQLGQVASVIPISPNTHSIPSQENQILKYEDVTETIEDKQTQRAGKTDQFIRSNNEIERARHSTKNDFISQIEQAFKNKSPYLQINNQKRKASINSKNNKVFEKNIIIQEEDSMKLNDKQTSRQTSEMNILSENSSLTNEENNQNVRNKFKKVGLLKSMYYFHDLFSIFLMFDPSISRLQRFVIMYMKNLHIFTSNIVFNKQYSIVQTLFLQVTNLIITAFVTKLIEHGISKNIILRRISQFILLSMILFYYYAFLAVISGTQPSQTNTISLLYFVILLADIFVVGVSLAFLQRFVANRILQNNEQIVGYRLTILNFLKFQLILINI